MYINVMRRIGSTWLNHQLVTSKLHGIFLPEQMQHTDAGEGCKCHCQTRGHWFILHDPKKISGDIKHDFVIFPALWGSFFQFDDLCFNYILKRLLEAIRQDAS